MNDPLTGRRAVKMKGQHKLLGMIMKNERRQQTLKEVVHEYFPQYTSVKPSKLIIDSFNLDVPKIQLKKALPKELQQFIAD